MNSEAGRIFAVRFFDHLLEGADPWHALAATKRDFMAPARLAAWMETRGLRSALSPEALREPYFWAAFVLVAGGQEARPSARR